MATTIAEQNRSGSGDYRSGQEFTRRFVVEDDGDQQLGIMGASALVGIVVGDEYDEPGTFAYCTNVSCDQDSNNFNVYTVTCKYNSKIEFPEGGSLAPSGDVSAPGSLPQNPTERPIVYRTSDFGADSRIDVINDPLDCDGQAMNNTAGDPLLDTQRDVTIVTFSATVNVETASLAQIDFYTDKCNDDDFLGFLAGKILCTKVALKPKNESKQQYVEKTLTFEIAPDSFPYFGTWRTKQYLNKGCRAIDEDDPAEFIAAAEDTWGRAINGEVMLKLDGTIADPEDDPVYVTYFYKKEQDFSDIFN